MVPNLVTSRGLRLAKSCPSGLFVAFIDIIVKFAPLIFILLQPLFCYGFLCENFTELPSFVYKDHGKFFSLKIREIEGEIKIAKKTFFIYHSGYEFAEWVKIPLTKIYDYVLLHDGVYLGTNVGLLRVDLARRWRLPWRSESPALKPKLVLRRIREVGSWEAVRDQHAFRLREEAWNAYKQDTFRLSSYSAQSVSVFENFDGQKLIQVNWRGVYQAPDYMDVVTKKIIDPTRVSVEEPQYFQDPFGVLWIRLVDPATRELYYHSPSNSKVNSRGVGQLGGVRALPLQVLEIRKINHAPFVEEIFLFDNGSIGVYRPVSLKGDYSDIYPAKGSETRSIGFIEFQKLMKTP